MTGARLSWSWLGFVGALLVLGFVEVFGVFFTQDFRRGLDADMALMMQAMGPFDMLGGAAAFALAGAPILLLARWIANRTGTPRSVFFILAASVPTVLMFASQMWWTVGAWLEGPSNIMPFEANAFFYLPNWLTLGFMAGGFLAAAATYAFVAKSREYR